LRIASLTSSRCARQYDAAASSDWLAVSNGASGASAAF
jgi:hypothetical protein